MSQHPVYASLFSSQARSDLLTRKEAANYLGVTQDTLAIWASTKRYDLPYVKMGRLVKYRREHLDAFIERRTVTRQEI
jgi:excisionase family DNA binding protein